MTWISLDVGLVGPVDPLGEGLALGPLIVEFGDDALDIVGEFGGGGLEAADLLAEGLAELAAQVDLEALDLLAGLVDHQLALEPDVGGLDPGAGVRAAVDVDRQGLVERRE